MCVHVPDSLVLLLARLGGRGRYSIVVSVAPSQVYLRLGVYFGYISSRIDLPRYSRFGPPQRSPFLKTTSILGLRSAVKGSPIFHLVRAAPSRYFQRARHCVEKPPIGVGSPALLL